MGAMQISYFKAGDAGVTETKEQQGVENICCPYLQIIPCGDTEEHKHLKCELMKTPIPNGRIVTWCVSVYKWKECIIYPGEPA